LRDDDVSGFSKNIQKHHHPSKNSWSLDLPGIPSRKGLLSQQLDFEKHPSETFIHKYHSDLGFSKNIQKHSLSIKYILELGSTWYSFQKRAPFTTIGFRKTSIRNIQSNHQRNI
jgi:hypothetical protein